MTPYHQSSINKLTSGFITKHIECYFDDGFFVSGQIGCYKIRSNTRSMVHKKRHKLGSVETKWNRRSWVLPEPS